jgi:hypothetical protein
MRVIQNIGIQHTARIDSEKRTARAIFGMGKLSFPEIA